VLGLADRDAEFLGSLATDRGPGALIVELAYGSLRKKPVGMAIDVGGETEPAS
jgi:hypothetical protein